MSISYPNTWNCVLTMTEQSRDSLRYSQQRPYSSSCYLKVVQFLVLTIQQATNQSWQGLDGIPSFATSDMRLPILGCLLQAGMGVQNQGWALTAIFSYFLASTEDSFLHMSI